MKSSIKSNGSGIYVIINLKNNKVYIGSATNLYNRFHTHEYRLRNKCHHSILLQRAWDKYGEKNFSFDLLELVEKDKLIQREQDYLNFFKPEYNICKVAGSSLGRKASKEERERMCIERKTRPKPNPDQYKKSVKTKTINGTLNHTPETIEKIRAGRIGEKS